MLYWPLDHTPHAILLIQHSLPCYNYYIGYRLKARDVMLTSIATHFMGSAGAKRAGICCVGYRLKARDVMLAGVATHFIPRNKVCSCVL